MWLRGVWLRTGCVTGLERGCDCAWGGIVALGLRF